MNKLLENSVSSIQIGVEDYFSNDTKRILSCVRNLSAGILLLFKSKLLDMCPLDSKEVLIKKKVIPILKDGQLRFIGKGETTIDVREIQERFNCSHEKEYTKCERCGAELSLEEQECEGLCFYCYDQFQKIMEDD